MPPLDLTPQDLELLVARIPTVPALAGLRVGDTTPLAQHASNRAYHRVFLVGDARPSSAAPVSGPQTVVVMKLSGSPLEADERTDGPRPTALPFLLIGNDLASACVPVPQILADWTDDGLLLLNDLGDTTFETHLSGIPRDAWLAEYHAAIDLLVGFHAAEQHLRSRDSLATSRRFGATLSSWELEHFREWCLVGLGVPVSAGAERVLADSFERIVRRVDQLPFGLCHRDYQSRNLMVTPAGLALIDFQDALLAPVAYDLVALLRDSYVVLDSEVVDSSLTHYLAARDETSALPRITLEELAAGFHWVTVQRKLKDAGRFVFIDRVKGNPGFLPYIPSSLSYVANALTFLPELADLAGLLQDLIPTIHARLTAEERKR